MLDLVLEIVGMLLYPLFAVFFSVIDAVQDIFFAFAGIGTVKFGGVSSMGWGGDQVTMNFTSTDEYSNGILYYLLNTPTIRNLLISFSILALFLLVIFTILAFIKNVYAAKQKKWQEIISSALKGLIHFIFIPVACLLGVLAGNMLLVVLNEATSGSSLVNSSLSHQLFVSSAYTGNIFRAGTGLEKQLAFSRMQRYYNDTNKTGGAQLGGWTWWEHLFLGQNRYASIMQLFEKEEGLDTSLVSGSYDSSRDEDYANLLDAYYKTPFANISTVTSVMVDYRIWDINYLLLGAGGVFMIFALMKLSFGMIKRLFTLLLLFVISPVVCALYPLDDGSGVNKWKGDFTKNFFMAYGAVVGLNIYFQLLPLITHIKVGSDVIGIVPLIITIAGLFMVSDFVSMLSQYLHGDDAYSAGGGIMNRVTGKMKQGAKFVGKQAVGAFTMHYKAKGAEKRVRDTFKDADTGKYKVGEGADAKEFDKDAFERTASESGFIGGIKARNRIRKNEKEFRKAFDKLGEDDKKAAGYDEVEKIRDDYAKGLITSATDWLGEKFGIGKPSDFSSKKKKEYMEAGSATTDAAIKLNKGIQDAIKTLTEAWDPSKESKEQFSSRQASTLAKLLRGPNGDTIFKTLKGNKDFKDYVNDPTNGFGLKLSETSAAEMADRLLGRKGVLDAQQREGEARAAKISFDEETKTFFENAINNAATATGSTWDKAEALKALMSNHQLVYGDGVATQDKNFADSLNATLQTRNEATAERKDKLNADVESATIQARDIVKAYSSETDNTAFNETMQQYLGYLQNNLNNLKNDKAIVDMDHHLQDKFTDLINKQSELIKRIKETSDAEKQAITKAIQDAAKNKDKK